MKPLLAFCGVLLATSLCALPPDAPEITIELKTTVNNLQLRTGAGLDAAVLALLPENARLQYLGHSSGKETEIWLRGVLCRGRWHYVNYFDEQTFRELKGWVYGGAVSVRSVSIPSEFPLDTLQYDFLKVEWIDRLAFEREYAGYRNPFIPGPPGLGCYPGAYMGLTMNGSEHPEMGASYWFELVSLVDSVQYDVHIGRTEIPIMSPNNQWLAAAHANGCEGYSALEFAKLKDGKWQEAFIMEQHTRIATRMAWTNTPGQLVMEWDEFLSDNPAVSVRAYYRVTFR